MKWACRGGPKAATCSPLARASCRGSRFAHQQNRFRPVASTVLARLRIVRPERGITLPGQPHPSGQRPDNRWFAVPKEAWRARIAQCLFGQQIAHRRHITGTRWQRHQVIASVVTCFIFNNAAAFGNACPEPALGRDWLYVALKSRVTRFDGIQRWAATRRPLSCDQS